MNGKRVEKVTAEVLVQDRTKSSELPKRRRVRREDESSFTPAQLEFARHMEAESARRKALREASRKPVERKTPAAKVVAVKMADAPVVVPAPAMTVAPVVIEQRTEVLTAETIGAAVSEGLRLSRVEMRRRERLAQGGGASSSGGDGSSRDAVISARDAVISAREYETYKASPTAISQPIAKPTSLPRTAAPRSRAPRNRVLQGMTVSALAVAGVAVPVLGNFGGGQAQASQPLSASMLGGQSQQVDTPSSLTGTPTAAIRSSAVEASEQAKANPANAQCSPEGAQGLRAAFIQERKNLVVFPLPAGTYHRSSTFGPRVDPFTGGSTYHAGQDYAAPMDTPIYAVADGVVVHAGGSYEGRSPNTIVVKHEIDGKVYESWYVHMYDHGVLVKEGDTIKAGQQIGLVGSNGNSTGPHLHLEIHDPSLGDGGDVSDLLTPDDFLSEHGAVDISEMCD